MPAELAARQTLNSERDGLLRRQIGTAEKSESAAISREFQTEFISDLERNWPREVSSTTNFDVPKPVFLLDFFTRFVREAIERRSRFELRWQMSPFVWQLVVEDAFVIRIGVTKVILSP